MRKLASGWTELCVCVAKTEPIERPAFPLMFPAAPRESWGVFAPRSPLRRKRGTTCHIRGGGGTDGAPDVWPSHVTSGLLVGVGGSGWDGMGWGLLPLEVPVSVEV